MWVNLYVAMFSCVFWQCVLCSSFTYFGFCIHHNRPSSYFDRTRAVSNKTRLLHALHQSPRCVWFNCLQRNFASCPHSFGNATVSSDLTADIVCRVLQEEITDDRGGGRTLQSTTFRVVVASHTIDKQALHDNQAVLRKLFDFSAVFPKVVLQTGIQKYDRRIGVCIESCREDACTS